MSCSLKKFKKEQPINYIGITGNKYPYNEYLNSGDGKTYKGLKDLPLDEYPYEIEFKTDFLFLCCKLCNCKDKV